MASVAERKGDAPDGAALSTCVDIARSGDSRVWPRCGLRTVTIPVS